MEINIATDINYTINIGVDIVEDALEKATKDNVFFICIDKRVYHFHRERLAPFLEAAKDVIIIESEEEYKSQETVERILAMLHTNQASRKSLLLGIGGGLVGDIVGYAAAIYMRGIPFIQIPTTLLSQVDSSIGSKVAINAFETKNIIGTFYSPAQVIIDLSFLTTLTTRIFKEGLVELIKHGFIKDQKIVQLLHQCPNIDALMNDQDLLLMLIKRSLHVKKMFVEADFFDTGIRHLLNFGHTFAHALEMSETNKLYHGECVAIGMLVSTKLAGEAETFNQVKALLEQFDCLRVLEDVDLTKILYDKKRLNNDIKEIILPKIGHPEIITYTLEKLMEQFTEIYKELQQDASLSVCKQQFHFRKVKLQGTIVTPPSKSYAHRFLIAAALSNAPTLLTGLHELSDDILVTTQSLTALGCKTEYDAHKGTLLVIPHSQQKSAQVQTVHMKESGTSLRLLIPVLISQLKTVRITGENKLPERPLNTYFDIFTDVHFTKEAVGKNLPLLCSGTITPGEYALEGNVSSQFISGLLFTLPLLNGKSKITMTSTLQSLPYVEMTLEVLAAFGIIAEHDDSYTIFSIPGNQQYHSTGTYAIEQDYSARGFFEVANAIADHDITILPPATQTTQGDAIVLDIIKDQLHEVDLMHAPDTAPILAILFSQITGMLHKTDRLKFKESDRLVAICAFLEKMGVPFKVDNDTLFIQQAKINGGHFDTHKDHRITMALIIASTISKDDFILDEIKSCEKSYKNFIEQYEQLGGFVDEK